MAAALETDRLFLRPYRIEDLVLLAPLYGDPAVMRYAKLGRQDLAQTRVNLEAYLRFWERHGFGMRALFQKSDEAFVGECGLFRLKSGLMALRYALGTAHWGRGFAVEAVRATLDEAFSVQALTLVRSIVEADNRASLRIMEKLDLPVVAEERAGPKTVLIHEIDRPTWLSRGVARS